ncbi:sugar transferase [Tropicibacter oceani]|uniref:Sugar transferase n=1 Tax=Tropicibacter oceani TaxID=3058420 RepID=A0ABY8QKT9_9RHOB|nr:sugar transferase [Tropicibacter oceani]WGW04628.1 sugar transferase [Tropicibacter oceani]
MTPFRRLIDILSAFVLGTVLMPLILWVTVLLLVKEGRPILYKAERMKTADKGFLLWKFRTMRPDAGDRGVSGGDKSDRITKTGAMLRRKRLDELPQLFNLLRGDVSLVGPRPPLRRYVEMYPSIYREVLKSRPGITGLASVVFHKHEERLLAQCRTAQETEQVYCRRCIPRKAQIDRLYEPRRNICTDFRVMFATVFRGVDPH